MEGGVGDTGLLGEFAYGRGFEGFALLDGTGGELEAGEGVLEDEQFAERESLDRE